MGLRQVLEVIDLLSPKTVTGDKVAEYLATRGIQDVSVRSVNGEYGATDFVSCVLPGTESDRPTLGIIGRLGGLGARPEALGLVSDADGAIASLAAALSLADMAAGGEPLPSTVRVHTHICPAASIRPNHPLPMMRSPLPLTEMMQHEVHQGMSAILSIDATKVGRLVNARGVALTPVVKEGWILPLPDDVLDVLSWVSGRPPLALPLTTQDITPFGNGLPHVNSILQPSTATSAPVIGVAITSAANVPGSATGANHAPDLDVAARFCVEIAKRLGHRGFQLYDEANFHALVSRYGSLAHLQTVGEAS